MIDITDAKQQALDDLGKMQMRIEQTKDMIKKANTMQELMIALMTSPLAEGMLKDEKRDGR